MSSFKGPFENNGSFGDLRYYYDPVLRKFMLSQKGGPTREQFLTHPNYKRPRANSSELGGRSKFASLLYQSLSDVKHLMYPRCFNQIVAAGRMIQKQDTVGTIGFRTIAVENASDVLAGIDFNERTPFRNVFRGAYETDLSPNQSIVALRLPGFVPDRHVHWVTTYNAYRVYLVIGQIADVAWDNVNKMYNPVVEDLEVLSQFAVSDWKSKNSESVDIELTAAFEQPALAKQNTAVIVAMGVEFASSIINGIPYALPGSGSMAIVACYSQSNN